MPRRALTFPATVDPARVVNGSYSFDNGEVMDIDAQILALETFALANQNRGQVTATVTLDAGSATTAVGDLLCLASSSAAVSVTRATATPLTAAGNIVCAIALQAIAPGLPILVALPGSLIPPSITGLTTGPKYVTANTSTARYTVAASYTGTDVVVGITDTANNLAFEPIAKGVAGGGGGGALAGDVTGTTGASTVVAMTGSGGVVNVASAVALVFNRTNPAAAGALRFANAENALINVRNAGNTADIQVLSTSGSAILIGDTTNTGNVTLTGTGTTKIGVSGGYGLYSYFASGITDLQGTTIGLTNNEAAGLAINFTPVYNGAASMAFSNTVTSAKVLVSDNTTNSATGIKMSLLGQNCTGTTTTGGELEVGPGTGTTANGKLSLVNIITTTSVGAAGAGSALPATPTGYLNVKVNGAAQRIPYYA